MWSPSTGLLLAAMVWYSFFLDADGAGVGGPKAGGAGGAGGGGGGGAGIAEISDDIFDDFSPSSAHKDKYPPCQKYFYECLLR